MSTAAVYAGSFDPFHLGHLDVLLQALRVFDTVHVVRAVSGSKEPYLPQALAEEIIRVSVPEAFRERVVVASHAGLVVDYAVRVGATALVRGLRNSRDFDAERPLAQGNHLLAPEIPTVFFMSDPRLEFLSSSAIRSLLKTGVGPARLANFLAPGVPEIL